MTAYTGAAATAGMFFLDGDRYLLGGLLLVVANAALAVSMVLYNAFLPQISTPDERDTVSSRGWAFGYTSGALVLLLNLVLYQGHDSFGLSEGEAVRICLASAGLWWGAFALIPLRRLRDRAVVREPGAGPAVSGWRQLVATLKDMRRYPLTLSFLLAYLIYNDGVQTVISQASVYGSEELELEQSTLIVAVLLVQVLAVVGALGMGRLARAYGAKRTILGSLAAWGADPGGGLLPAGPDAGVVLRARGDDRAGAGRQPGAVALAVLASGAGGQGSRVLFRVRDERSRAELGGAVGVRPDLSGHGQLPGRDHLVGVLLRTGFRAPRQGAGAARGAGGGESCSRADLRGIRGYAGVTV
ncbi:hypothetical protein GCM10020254_68740 [Streptomyces goshikiensis]